MTIRSLLIAALCALTLTGAQAQETLYGEDLAWRLINPNDIRRVTSIKARLRRESNKAEAIFVLRPPPFESIPAAPNQGGRTTAPPKMWSLPPWPSLDPPLPDDLPDSVRREIENRRSRGAIADIWGDILPPGADIDKSSVRLRPRVIPLDQKLVFRNKEIPEPFSLRRYYDRAEIFVEIAAYGGTTSFKAEEAFRAMKEAATRQQKMEGFGRESFLTRVILTEDLPEEKPESESDLPEAPPFADLAPMERARPDLTDSAKAAALEAPAFQELEVVDLIGKRVSYPKGPKKYKAESGRVKNSLLVLVAFFPDEAVTLSFVLEERMGSVQDLMAIALLAQRRLKEDIEPNS